MNSAEPPALATTKRKFHRLLDSMTAPTSTSTTSLASSNASDTSLGQLSTMTTTATATAANGTPEHPSKRPRSSNLSAERERSISASQERIRALKEQLLTPRREGTVRVVGSSTAPSVHASSNNSTVHTTKISATPRKPANFQPHSQDSFLTRLKTFADMRRWTTKPLSINEVAWAKRGWSCDDDAWNTVACKGGCEKRVVVRLRPKRRDVEGKEVERSEDLGVEVEEKLVGRFGDLIVTGHAEGCLWRKRGCGNDIQHLPLANRTASTAALLERYTSFQPLLSSLPLPQNITFPGPSLTHLLSHMPSNLFLSTATIAPPSTPPEFTAYALSLFGWSGTLESRIALATCSSCFQRIGLWLSSDNRITEMSAKLGVSKDSLRLNLLESHREWCPWKDGASQANPSGGRVEGMSGWETLQFVSLGKGQPESRGGGSRDGREMSAESLTGEDGYGEEKGSGESVRQVGEDTETLQNKWRKFKAKLRRTTSKKSIKSVKSVKSMRSGKSGGEVEDR